MASSPSTSRALTCALLAISAFLCSVSCAYGELINQDVTRTIDMKTHICNIITEVSVKNTGSSAVSLYKLADPAVDGVLAFASAKLVNSDDELPMTSEGVSVSIGAGKQVSLVITQVFIHAQKPYPAELRQTDTQLVKFTGSLYFPTPYATTTQTTKVLVAGKTESFTKAKPYSNDGQEITYGPYQDVSADKAQTLTVHFENSTPFLTTTKLVREIMVSHWGYASISEDISLVHSGGKLVGEFSRLDYQRDPRAGRNAVRTFTTRLPAAATNVNYRDVIGNISTSHLREERDAVVVEIQPRFPLFGGWKTQYQLSYDLPSGEILGTSGSEFVVETRFIGHIYDDQVVDEAEIRVVLPEGASDIKVNTPFPVDSQSSDVLVTYFDTTGRPVVILTKSNLVEEHMQDFTVSYTLPATAIVREPVMAVAFFFVLFVVAIVLNRLDFSLAADPVAVKKKD
eukprot:m.128709 g.128709  ORF g.128709 m.128709 type:complete len:456 (+) comp15677_c1_seq1:133-1500(+)